MSFVRAAKTADIPAQSAKCIEVRGKRIAVFNLGGEFHAIADECTHEGGPLSEGIIKGDEVECPWHGACFHIKTGRVTLDPASDDVASYGVRIVGEHLEIDV